MRSLLLLLRTWFLLFSLSLLATQETNAHYLSFFTTSLSLSYERIIDETTKTHETSVLVPSRQPLQQH